MKYFILGSVSSAILLYGISLIFGVTGSLGLEAIATSIRGIAGNEALLLGIILLAAGLCFKVAAVPFHVWTPDVYVGAPTPITAFLSTASKGAAFAIFARIFYMALADFRLDWGAVLATVAALSMIVGNLAAVTQDNVKRMLAYSSIGHAGYALLGILAMSELGLTSVLVYMLVYIVRHARDLGARSDASRSASTRARAIYDFAGLHSRAPFWAFAMVIFLLSLGGIPPTAGFIGKYYLFLAAIGSGWGWLAIIAVLMSAVSMFYYFRLVVAMYLRDDAGAELAGGRVAEVRGGGLPGDHARARRGPAAAARAGGTIPARGRHGRDEVDCARAEWTKRSDRELVAEPSPKSSVARIDCFRIAIAVGYGLGWWLDRKLGTGPWLTIVLTGLGVIGAFVQLFRLGARNDRNEPPAGGSGTG